MLTSSTTCPAPSHRLVPAAAAARTAFVFSPPLFEAAAGRVGAFPDRFLR